MSKQLAAAILAATSLAEAHALALAYAQPAKPARPGAEAFHRAYVDAVRRAGGITFRDPWAEWPTARTYRTTDAQGRVSTVRLPAQARMPAPRHWAGGKWPACLVVDTSARSTAAEVSARWEAHWAAEAERWAMIRGKPSKHAASITATVLRPVWRPRCPYLRATSLTPAAPLQIAA